MTVNPVHLCLGLYLLPMGIWLLYQLIPKAHGLTQRFQGFSPKEAYAACHDTLDRIVLNAWTLMPILDTQPAVTWANYTISRDGILVEHSPLSPSGAQSALVPLLPWSNVSGVGLEMRPLYNYAPTSKGYWYNSTRINTGYQFNILIVLIAGATLNISLPLRDNESAIDFAAHVLAFARNHERRLSLMGFDKAITRSVVHLEVF